MANIIDVRNEIVDLLTEELTDPNRSRRTDDRDFVFSDSNDVLNEFPRVIVYILDGQSQGLSVGQPDRFERKRLQVSIQVGNENKFDIDQDDDLETAGDVKHYWAERIDSIIIQNQSRFRDLDQRFYSLLPDSDNPTNPDGMTQVSNDYILRRRKN